MNSQESSNTTLSVRFDLTRHSEGTAFRDEGNVPSMPLHHHPIPRFSSRSMRTAVFQQQREWQANRTEINFVPVRISRDRLLSKLLNQLCRQAILRTFGKVRQSLLQTLLPVFVGQREKPLEGCVLLVEQQESRLNIMTGADSMTQQRLQHQPVIPIFLSFDSFLFCSLSALTMPNRPRSRNM